MYNFKFLLVFILIIDRRILKTIIKNIKSSILFVFYNI